MKKENLVLGSIFVVALLDQLTKALFWNAQHTTGLIFITHTFNKGFAFGSLPDLSLLWAVIAAIFVVYIIFKWRTLPYPLGFAVIAGGALGNLTDRILHGAVFDWIGIQGFSVFNLADVAITCGVIYIIAREVLDKDQKNNQKSSRSSKLSR